ncbi:MAG: hypothetical protein R3F55_11375 [Alphaproteobacteria bacterium]
MARPRITPSIVVSAVAVLISAGAVFFAYDAWQGTRENFGFQLHKASTALDIRDDERTVALATTWSLYVTNLSAVEARLIRCGLAGDFFPDFAAAECSLRLSDSGADAPRTLVEAPLEFRPGETKRLAIDATLYLTNVGVAFDDYFDGLKDQPSFEAWLRESEQDVFRNGFAGRCEYGPDGAPRACAPPQDGAEARNPVVGFVFESGRGNRFVFSQRYFEFPSLPGSY